MNWFGLAACKGKDNTMFYGNEKGNIPSELSKKAKRMCSECSVPNECLNFAIENDESYGIWGGLTAKERKAIVREYGKITVEEIRKIVGINVRQISNQNN